MNRTEGIVQVKVPRDQRIQRIFEAGDDVTSLQLADSFRSPALFHSGSRLTSPSTSLDKPHEGDP